MNPFILGGGTAACVFLGGFAGLRLHRFLPPTHQTKETQEVVRLGIGMLSVLASLVLGLLISTAKSSYDGTDRSVRAFSADLILLNEVLRDYGDAAASPRDALRRFTEGTIRNIWPDDAATRKLDDVATDVMLDHVRERIRGLRPTDAEGKDLQNQALAIHLELAKQRWQIIEQEGPAIRPLVLGILICWITCIFASFGWNAPRNGTVVASFAICSLAIGGAIFMVLAMDNPMSGVMRIASDPMLNALSHMTR